MAPPVIKQKVGPEVGAAFRRELKTITSMRGNQDADIQGMLRDAITRHAADGEITLTDLLLIPEVGLRFFATEMAMGRVYNKRTQTCEATPQSMKEQPWKEIRLRSLARGADGSYRVPPLKIGPPIEANGPRTREMEMRGIDRYQKQRFEVDPQTGLFLVPSDPASAKMLIENHGAPVRMRRHSKRWVSVPVTELNPEGRIQREVDEWLLAEVAFLERHPEVMSIGKPEPDEAPVIFAPGVIPARATQKENTP